MTDAEMVKAMEICKDKEIPCDDCPLVECGDCEGISRQYFYDRFKQLQSENAELKSSLTHANEECLKWHERAQNLLKDSGGSISGYEKKISDLQAENAALRERLDKAVELPCKIGDEVYEVHGKCDRKNCVYNGYYGQWRCDYGGKTNCNPFITVNKFRYCDIPMVGKTIFVTKEAAEARLKELEVEE